MNNKRKGTKKNQASEKFSEHNKQKIASFEIFIGKLKEKQTILLDRPNMLLDKLNQIPVDFVDHFISVENLELISQCTEAEKQRVYPIFRNIIFVYNELFCELYALIDANEYLREQLSSPLYNALCYYYDSFLPSIKQFPLGLEYAQISLSLICRYFEHFKESLSYEDTKNLLVRSEMLFDYITNQSPNLEGKAPPERSYSILLYFYTLIYEKYPEDFSLGHIIKFLNKSKKIQLMDGRYFDVIRVISDTKIPSFSIIYHCFNKLDKKNHFERGVIFHFGQALQNIYDHVSNHPGETCLDKESLKALLKMFNAIKERLDIKHYLLLAELLVAHKSLLESDKLEKIYEYAEDYIRLAKSDADNTDSNTFVDNIMILISKMELPGLDKLIRIIDFWEEKFKPSTDENFVQKIYRRLLIILLKRKNYPTAEFANLLDKVIEEVSLSAEEIYQLISNIDELHKNSVDAQLLKICNKYREIIKADSALLVLLFSKLDKSFLEKADDGEFLLTQQGLYTELQDLKCQYRCEIEVLKGVSSFKRILARFHDLLDCIEHQVAFDKASHVIKELTAQLLKLYEINKKANEYGIRMNRYMSGFLNILNQSEPSIAELEDIVSQSHNEIEEEIKSIQNAEVVELSLDQARHMLKKGCFDELVRLNQSLSKPSHDQEWLFMKIECLLKLRYYEDAMFWLEENRKRFPTKNKEKSAILWAQCCVSLAQYKEALDVYQDLQSQRKNTKRNYDMQIAFCHRMIGSAEDYIIALQTYNSLDLRISSDLSKTLPTSEEYARLMRQKKKIEREKIRCIISSNLIKAAEPFMQSLDDEPENLILQAQFYYKQFNFLKASENYERAIQKSFKFEWLKYLLVCYTRSKELFFEKQDFFRALLEEHKENSAICCEIQVLLLMHTDNYVDALELINKMKETWGISEFIVLNRAMIYMKLGETQEAISSLISFPQHHKNKYFLKQLGIIYSGAGISEKALKCFDYLLEEYPTFFSFYDKAIYYFITLNDKQRVSVYWEQYQNLAIKYTFYKNHKLEKKVKSYLSRADDCHVQDSVDEDVLLLEETDLNLEMDDDFITPKNFGFSDEQDDLLDDSGIDSNLRVSTFSLFSVEPEHCARQRMSLKADATEEEGYDDSLKR